MLNANEMFLCERIPGGLFLSEPGCAKQYLKAKEVPHRLRWCIECSTGEENAGQLTDLTWVKKGRMSQKGTVMWLADEHEDGAFLAPEDAGEIDPGWSDNRLGEHNFREVRETPNDLITDQFVLSLMRSILFYSIKEFLGASSKEERRKQEKWLLSKKTGHLFSCRSICRMAGIDYQGLVSRIKQKNTIA